MGPRQQPRRLDVGRAGQGATAGLVQLLDRLTVEPGQLEMVAENLRLSLAAAGEIRLQHGGNAGVDSLALRLQHALIGGLLDERMLEGTHRLRGVAANAAEPELNQAMKRRGGGRFVRPGNLARELQREAAPDGTADLRGFLAA